MGTENENDVQGQEPDVTQAPSGTDDNVSQQQDNSNDLYAPYLEKFPSSLHPVAQEVFREWDGNVTKRIQSVHQEYEPYKPFIQNYEPDAIQQAIAIAEAMERDPQAFIDAAMNAYGLTPAQAMQQVDDAQQQVQAPEFDLDDPAQQRLAQHEQLLATMAEAMLRERQEREEAVLFQQQEEDYNTAMQQLTEKYGEFDQQYVNVLLAQGYEPEAAVQTWQSQVETFAQQRLAPNQQAPVVMGAGGGTPSIQRDVENLSSQDTRRLVEEMLRAAKES